MTAAPTYLGRLCDDGEGTHEVDISVWWKDAAGQEHDGWFHCLVTPVADLGPDPYDTEVEDNLPLARAERLVDDELSRRMKAEGWDDCTLTGERPEHGGETEQLAAAHLAPGDTVDGVTVTEQHASATSDGRVCHVWIRLHLADGRTLDHLRPDTMLWASSHDELPVHQPIAPDAPIPGRNWWGGCEPGGDWCSETGRYDGMGPRVTPAGVCESCGETACPTCGAGFYPDGGCQCNRP